MQVFVRAAAAVALSFVAIPATAAIVADTLPYENTPAWSDVKFDGHWTTTATTSRLTTASGGIWFGWQEGTNTPSWSPASNADGHYLDLTMSLSAGARDWSAYFGDGQRFAGLAFNPTYGCDGNAQACYFAPYSNGVNLSFAGPGNSVADIFVPLDLNVANRFEFFLVGNQIDYRINGRRYTGIAQATGSRILVIGDGSGSTRTGSGSMLVSNVSLQTMPAFAELVDMAPEPASWAMLIIGFGLTGAMMRRRREAAAAPAA